MNSRTISLTVYHSRGAERWRSSDEIELSAWERLFLGLLGFQISDPCCFITLAHLLIMNLVLNEAQIVSGFRKRRKNVLVNIKAKTFFLARFWLGCEREMLCTKYNLLKFTLATLLSCLICLQDYFFSLSPSFFTFQTIVSAWKIEGIFLFTFYYGLARVNHFKSSQWIWRVHFFNLQKSCYYHNTTAVLSVLILSVFANEHFI